MNEPLTERRSLEDERTIADRRSLSGRRRAASDRFTKGPVSQGSSRGSVAENGDLAVTTLGWAETDKPFLFPLDRPIPVKAGDLIRIANKKAMSGNPNSAFINAFINKDRSIASNVLIANWLSSAYTYTASEDFSVTGISVSPKTGSMGSFAWHSVISINGKEIVA